MTAKHGGTMHTATLIVRYEALLIAHERQLNRLRKIRHWPEREIGHKVKRRRTNREMDIQRGLICQLRFILDLLRCGQQAQLLGLINATDAYLTERIRGHSAGSKRIGKSEAKREHYEAMRDQLRMVQEDLTSEDMLEQPVLL